MNDSPNKILDLLDITISLIYHHVQTIPDYCGDH